MNDVAVDLILYAIVSDAVAGDFDRCATVEVSRGAGGWRVSVRPTRDREGRGGSTWADVRGRPRIFRTALRATRAVERERPNERLCWHQKIRLSSGARRASAGPR
jgi:hypothetical protein